jgi:hypothetical protein
MAEPKKWNSMHPVNSAAPLVKRPGSELFAQPAIRSHADRAPLRIVIIEAI